MLSLGLLGIVGLAFGRRTRELKVLLLMALCSGFLAMQVVRTGSRGAVIALIVGFLVFPLKKTKRLSSKIQLVLLGVLAIGFLAWSSYRSDSVRERWEVPSPPVTRPAGIPFFLRRGTCSWRSPCLAGGP